MSSMQLPRLILVLSFLTCVPGCSNPQNKAVVGQIHGIHQGMTVIQDGVHALRLLSSFPKGGHWKDMSYDAGMSEVNRLQARVDEALSQQKAIMRTVEELHLTLSEETWSVSPELRAQILELIDFDAGQLEEPGSLDILTEKFRAFLVSNGVKNLD